MKETPDHTIPDMIFVATEAIVLKDPVLFERLASYIDQLIKTDFERLIALLYRIDVNENKLRQLLCDNLNTDAGKLIAASIIERQLQKIELRRNTSVADPGIDENEKW
ncbi:MAG: hypothetical protein ABIO04_08495 [Ferruginibacter sp.]